MNPEYSIEPKSRKDLRVLANIIRKEFKIEDVLYVPIVKMLDAFAAMFKGFSYEIVEDSELPENVHARTDVMGGHIVIAESVYNGAVEGSGRDRMTIAHEICHYFTICHEGFAVNRSFKTTLKPYEDPEWQAKCMAGELMINKKLVRSMSPSEIVDKCGVSLEAAMYQYRQYRKEENM